MRQEAVDIPAKTHGESTATRDSQDSQQDSPGVAEDRDDFSDGIDRLGSMDFHEMNRVRHHEMRSYQALEDSVAMGLMDASELERYDDDDPTATERVLECIPADTKPLSRTELLGNGIDNSVRISVRDFFAAQASASLVHGRTVGMSPVSGLTALHFRQMQDLAMGREMSGDDGSRMATTKVCKIVTKIDDTAYKTEPKRLFYNDTKITLSTTDKHKYRGDGTAVIAATTRANTVLAPQSLLADKTNQPAKGPPNFSLMGQPDIYNATNLEKHMKQPLKEYAKENLLLQQELIAMTPGGWRACDAKTGEVIDDDHKLFKEACDIIKKYIEGTNDKWYHNEVLRAQQQALPRTLLRNDPLKWVQKRLSSRPEAKRKPRKGTKKQQIPTAEPQRRFCLVHKSQFHSDTYFEGFGDPPSVDEKGDESSEPQKHDSMSPVEDRELPIVEWLHSLAFSLERVVEK
ncbi:hypothetical protein CLAFUW4_04649 [Fulvia fulva]|nr:hypothetical protein CLAFUR4_04635 [Fulvia fulva]WPV14324.1 hypothetical protein CLAFUW4_04649 [Fulvia fulva]